MQLTGDDAGRSIAIEDTAAAERLFDALDPVTYLPLGDRLDLLAPGDSLELAT